MKTLILASQSPRRSEILKNAKFSFVPFPVYVSEIPDKNLSLNEQIIDIARRKAKACYDLYPGITSDHLILASDTMVCLEDETGPKALGKPENEKDAIQTLLQLSGKEHEVKTALVLIDCETSEIISHIETTTVYFKNLDLKEIESYVATGEPLDKAGSYAIQGKGSVFVEKIKGDFNNVVGLPLDSLLKILADHQWKIKNA